MAAPGIDIQALRRRSDGSLLPHMQVVGFHVEGATPSPIVGSTLLSSLPAGAGSPSPVIIPPTFQVCYTQHVCKHTDSCAGLYRVSWLLLFGRDLGGWPPVCQFESAHLPF